jgi:uncharacterized protein DUF87/type IV secretory system conjugative DNA transfer VirD4/TraG family protein
MSDDSRTVDELVTEQFYAWEQRGRGWQLWPEPVWLEPPFTPFFRHAPPAQNLPDDGRVPSLWSRVGTLLSSFFTKRIPDVEPDPEDDPPPEPCDESPPLVELQLLLPAQGAVSPEQSEHFLGSLTSLAWPLAFEIVGTSGQVSIRLACAEPDHDLVTEQLRAHFADAVLAAAERSVEESWPGPNTEYVIVDFGLSHEFMRPLNTVNRFEPIDPLAGIVGALSRLVQGELGVLQVLFTPARAPWVASVLRSVSDDGKAFFCNAPEMLTLAREKSSRPLFAAQIRMLGASPQPSRAWQMVRSVGGCLNQFTDPLSNELIPLSNDGYDDQDHLDDFLERRSRRTGMLLNSQELVSLVHPPSPAVRCEKLARLTHITKAPPAIALGGGIVLGDSVHQGVRQEVCLDTSQRLKHVHVVGASGTGKSTLLVNLILQDIEQGHGVGVLDPHGDLIDEILSRIPEERMSDVVLVDPGDIEHPVGFNILSAHTDLERTILASDLVAVFRRLSTSWGDQMTSVLGNAVLAFLESSRGGTLSELKRFLVEPEFRKAFLASIQDPEVVYYWEREFPLLQGRPQAPLLTRLDIFLRPKPIRAMVSQHENRLDFAAVMNEGRIFLAKLAQGAIGEENAALLGTLFTAKFHQMTMGRQELDQGQRRPFFLYLDEFHNFITPSMAALLSGARKYRLGLVLAHQELRQLLKDGDVASAVLANAATRVCFRVSDQDARRLEDGLATFTARDLQNLGTGQAICRVERAEYDFNLETRPMPDIDLQIARERRERITAMSRDRYANQPAMAASWSLDFDTPASSNPTPLAAYPLATHKPSPASARSTSRLRRSPTPPPAPKPSAALPGRGGPQHRYLQNLIKRWAEDRGWQAVIEKPVLDGLGSVDVSLSRGDQSIACEIAVSSTVEQEIGNIQKCLAAGYAPVVVVCVDPKLRRALATALHDAVGDDAMARVRILAPEELFAFLDEQSHVPTQATLVRGYRVHITQPHSNRLTQQAIAQTVLTALRRIGRRRAVNHRDTP